MVGNADTLASMDPVRREAVLRRIRVIEQFLEGPGGDDEVYAAAKQLGMGISSFYRIARVWRETRDPFRLGIRSKRPSMDGANVIEAQRIDIIRTAAAEMPRNAARTRVLERARQIAADRNVSLPNVGELRRLVYRAAPRPVASDGSEAGPGMLIVDHVAIDMGVVFSPERPPVRPIATILADGDTGGILNLALGATPPTATTVAGLLSGALGAGIVASDPNADVERVRPVWIDGHEGDGWGLLFQRLDEVGFRRLGRARGASRRSWINERLGGEICGVLLKPFLTHAPADARDWQPRRRHHGAIGPDEARRLLMLESEAQRNAASTPIVASCDVRSLSRMLDGLKQCQKST